MALISYSRQSRKPFQEIITDINDCSMNVLFYNKDIFVEPKKLTKLADDKNRDAEQRIEATTLAAHLERAVHDMTYFAPSYLRT